MQTSRQGATGGCFHRQTASIEALERRSLLSGSVAGPLPRSTLAPDTTGTESPLAASSLNLVFRRSTIPTSVVSTVNDRGVIQLTIVNNGQSAFDASTPINLYASADGTLDSGAVLIASVPHVTSLKPGASGNVQAAIKSLPKTLDGTYTLLAELTDPTTQSTVQAVDGTQVTVKPASIRFSETLVSSKLPTGNGKGKSAGDAKLTITNSGNIVSKGKTTILLYASSDGYIADGTLIKSEVVSLPLKPGASRTLNVPLTTVAPAADTYLIGKVTDPLGNVSTFSTFPGRIITQYALPAGSQPQQIIEGPDGNLYCTAGSGGANGIFQITPQGVVTEFPIPTPNASPTGLAVGSDGNIWFAEAAPGVNAIDSVTTAGVFQTPIPIPTADAIPTSLTLGPDGDIWFTEQGADKIGVVRSGAISEYTIPTANSQPFGIAPGPGGDLWFTERNTGRIGKISTGGLITDYSLNDTTAQPLEITQGPDGNMWFTESEAGEIGSITPAGAVTTYAASTGSNGVPYGIAAGTDGTLYFTNSLLGDIGQITTGGQLTEYPVPTSGATLQGICQGPDGQIWFCNTAVISGDASVDVLSAA